MIRCLILVVLLSATSLADVAAVIDGPKLASPGDLVVLDGSQSVGDGHRWVIPDGLQTLACGNVGPGQLAFASGKAGAYTFGLIVADKEASIDYVTHTVTIAGSLPTPEPVPDPVPDQPEEPEQPGPTPVPGLEQLEKLSAERSAALADPETAKGLAEIIRNTDRAIEQMCAGGQCPGLSATKAMMVAAIEQRLAARRGASLQVNWLDGWRVPVNEAINRLNAADVPTYRAMMRAVAAGLSR